MADTSIAITAGSGTSVDTRTEATNGNHRQVVVLGDPSTNAGVAPVDATNGLAVDVKQSALPTGAATSAKQDTGNASLATLAGAVSGTEVQVDVLTMPTTTVQATNLDIRDLSSASDSVTAVQATAGNLNMTEANSGAIKTSVELIDDAVYTDGSGTPSKAMGVAGTDGTNPQIIKTDANGELQVDVLSIAAGNNNIGDVDVASIAAGDNNIGNVDIVSLPAGNLGMQAMAASISTVPANNITDATYIGDIKFGESLPAGTNALGGVTGAGSNAQIKDDTFYAEDITSGVLSTHARLWDGAAYDRQPGNSTDGALVNLGANNDVSLNAGTNAIGKLLPPDIDITGHTNYIRKYYTNAGAVTDGIIWSPAAGKRWHVVSLYFQTSAAATITFEDDKAGGDDPVLKGEFAANSGLSINFGEKYPMASGEDAADLIITTSAGNVYCTVVGYEI